MTDFTVALSTAVTPETGFPKKVVDDVCKKVEWLVRNHNAEFYWIGIATTATMKDRWNTKYKALGCNYIAKIYQTTSDDHRKEVETLLITKCKKSKAKFLKTIKNKVAGGGGPVGESDECCVYIALKKGWIKKKEAK